MARSEAENRRRFPADFMFQLNKKEAESLTSQFAISKKGRGGRRTLPYAFTEMWSKFSAHVTGIPSSVVRTTSVLRPRIVRVTGATMISFRRSITSLRVRIRIGRRLSGTRKVYQRISPGFHATFSQPSASQARESSSLENSDAVGGCAR